MTVASKTEPSQDNDPITVERCDAAIRRHWDDLSNSTLDRKLTLDWIDVWLDRRNMLEPPRPIE